jgi:hypothetical protein
VVGNEFRCLSVKRKNMRLRSAQEDFETNTLAAVPGLLGKLLYLGALHDGNGTYRHWGLERVYGNGVARSAISACHRAVLSRILKTPLSVLQNDVEVSSASSQLATGELLCSLRLRQLLPKSAAPASQTHFTSVLHALSALAETANSANRQNA